MSIEFKNSNLYLTGVGMDTNGNRIIKLAIGSNRGFSIQTNGKLPKTHSLISGMKDADLKKLTQAELSTIEKEVAPYIKAYGTDTQKKKLKIFKR